MGFAVQLYFDSLSSSKIEELWQEVNSPLLKAGSRPHLSLAVFDEIEKEKMIAGVQKFSEQEQQFEVKFSSVGTFPTDRGVVYIAPVVSSQLLAIHQRFHQQIAPCWGNCYDYYKSASWVPHCTIREELHGEELREVIETSTKKQELFINVSIEGIELVQYKPTQKLTICPFAE